MSNISKHLLINFLILLLAAGFVLIDAAWYWWLVAFLFYALIIFLGSYFIQLNFFLPSQNRGSKVEKQVALTFDDGPLEAFTPQLLQLLKEENVPATFFLIGKNVMTQEKIVQQIFDAGHYIGNHSYEHGFWFSMQQASTIKRDIERCNVAIENAIGCRPKLFRPPYGVTNPWVAWAIEQTNMHSIGWSLRSYDTIAKSKEELVTRVTKNLKNGDVILLHDWGSQTLATLPQIISYVRAQGFSIVPLPQLLNISPYVD